MKLQVILLNKDHLGTNKVYYRVYFMKNDHDGELFAELSSITRANDFYTVRSITFVKPGYYKVDVFDANNNRLTSGSVTISDR